MTARELRDIGELGLSEKSAMYFASRGFEPQHLVYYGRWFEHNTRVDERGLNYVPGVESMSFWTIKFNGRTFFVSLDRMRELVKCLKALGLIRPELKKDLAGNIDSFNLYAYGRDSKYCIWSREFSGDDRYSQFNDCYETYVPIFECT